MKLPSLTDKIIDVYDKHGNIIIAVDFDDTIYNYSGQNFDTEYVIGLLKRAKTLLNAKLILFTCREGAFLENALSYCDDVGLSLDAVNTSLETYAYPSRKPFYNILLDDKASLPECCSALETLLHART
jgi:hypothetical protein